MSSRALAHFAAPLALLVGVSACTAEPPSSLSSGGGAGVTASGGTGAGTGGTGASGGAGAGGSSTGGGIGGGGTSSAGSSSAGTSSAGTSSAGTSSAGSSAGGVGAGGAGSGGSGGDAGGMGEAGQGAAGSGGSAGGTSEPFSFFVTSIAAMQQLASEFGAGDDGFGGDLRYGEATGLAGADKICRTIAGMALAGAENKTWRAFLSTQHGGEGDGPIHAIDRVGEGPWYDRLGRLVAANKTDLLGERPVGADPLIINDLPNEQGVPNNKDGAPTCTGRDCPDNHDTMTGTGPDGRLYGTNAAYTCNDWTSSAGEPGPNNRANGPWCGHSWPGDYSGRNWMSALQEGGCAPGSNLVHGGGPQAGVFTVGTGGGYGGIYCFALEP